ncbi:hypothetical protein CBM2615_B140137 [Cupriavidus taiwanensis]|uniref:Uncharacterized protein n=1 Tax=Cupriavidus taiwanensis TaxID=164546 RepID=A0A375E6X7_9BURK|nr:hypothetical protein CBM2615_B140137 [Cupriavidus taiwanensis]SOZ68015.1 hypothetical protein CBM2613_B110137 [Cupriavidus taiwanensis]SPA07862.1 hypothetical protein CBM2625_B110137 [Cupriavidus taiwanensis]
MWRPGMRHTVLAIKAGTGNGRLAGMSAPDAVAAARTDSEWM